MPTEEQIIFAEKMINEKNYDISALMYDMQNLSTADHADSNLHDWLAGLSSDGYVTLIERLGRW